MDIISFSIGNISATYPPSVGREIFPGDMAMEYARAALTAAFAGGIAVLCRAANS